MVSNDNKRVTLVWLMTLEDVHHNYKVILRLELIVIMKSSNYKNIFEGLE